MVVISYHGAVFNTQFSIIYFISSTLIFVLNILITALTLIVQHFLKI